MLVMYLCVSGVDVGHVFVCYGCQCWSCMCVWVSMLVMYLCVRDTDVIHAFVC
jgi:hypothetical protein